jgi:hypothetical protein
MRTRGQTLKSLSFPSIKPNGYKQEIRINDRNFVRSPKQKKSESELPAHSWSDRARLLGSA